MRLIPSLFVTLAALAAQTGCGTKTPLTLPPQAQPASASSTPPAPDNSNKAAEPRQ
jgi:predicted small lipoprotein YifL